MNKTKLSMKINSSFSDLEMNYLLPSRNLHNLPKHSNKFNRKHNATLTRKQSKDTVKIYNHKKIFINKARTNIIKTCARDALISIICCGIGP